MFEDKEKKKIHLWPAFKKFLSLSAKDKIWIILNSYLSHFSSEYQNYFNFSGKYCFTNRSKNKKKLLIVVAGYKEFLWDVVFGRIKKFVDNDIDICVVSPGLYSKRLDDICKENDWSYLYTKENKLSLAQNIAIKLHKKAEYIYKLDEDIFIGKNYFINLLRGLIEIKEEGIYKPGFVAPVLNVNGFSYLFFLEKIGKKSDYLRAFGELRSACMGVKAHYDPKAAIYLWEAIFPIDQSVKLFADEKGYLVIPHRFSIGAILVEREIWEMNCGFMVAKNGSLGVEEEQICRFCSEKSMPAFLIKNTLAGHFAFGPQNGNMEKYFIKNKKNFV